MFLYFHFLSDFFMFDFAWKKKIVKDIQLIHSDAFDPLFSMENIL